jgi:hypothetical protein
LGVFFAAQVNANSNDKAKVSIFFIYIELYFIFYRFYESAGPLPYFQIVYLSCIYMKPQCGPHLVEPKNTCGTRIHGHHTVCLVVIYLKYVRMPANEELWLELADKLEGAPAVMTRVSSDVHHEHADPVGIEGKVFRMDLAYAITVAIPENTLERLEICDDIACGEIAEIAGMPYFVDRFQKLPEGIVEYAVRIGNETYVHQPLNLYYYLLAVQPHGHPKKNQHEYDGIHQRSVNVVSENRNATIPVKPGLGGHHSRTDSSVGQSLSDFPFRDAHYDPGEDS